MTVRIVDGAPLRLRYGDHVTYSQTWDYENGLVQVVSVGEVVSFTYGADGALVKKVLDGETTDYVGNYYERGLEATTETAYYYFYPLTGTGPLKGTDGQRVALRTEGVLEPLMG